MTSAHLHSRALPSPHFWPSFSNGLRIHDTVCGRTNLHTDTYPYATFCVPPWHARKRADSAMYVELGVRYLFPNACCCFSRLPDLIGRVFCSTRVDCIMTLARLERLGVCCTSGPIAPTTVTIHVAGPSPYASTQTSSHARPLQRHGNGRWPWCVACTTALWSNDFCRGFWL